MSVQSLTGDYRVDCISVTKLRGIHNDGTEHWDEWCYKHHHWLNGKDAKSVVQEMIDAALARPSGQHKENK